MSFYDVIAALFLVVVLIGLRIFHSFRKLSSENFPSSFGDSIGTFVGLLVSVCGAAGMGLSLYLSYKSIPS